MMRDPVPLAEPVLRVRGLAKRFVLHLRDGAQLSVLDDVSLDVRAGECVALVGPSGRGKSTLMKCLYGNYAADGGSIVFRAAEGDVDLARADARSILALRRRDLGYVSQFLRVLPRVPTLDLVAERVLQAAPVQAGVDLDREDPRSADARARAAALLARLNLPPPLWQLPPATFSGGEQQRVNIARGFVVPARLLLLDEPTASLDIANRRVVVELIQEAKAAGTAIVGIFHDPQVRDAVASRCIELARATEGTP